MFRPTFIAVALIAAPSLAQAQAAAAGANPSLPRAELIAKVEAEFTKVDANKDGQMSRTEIENVQRAAATARAQAVFTALDGDKNGQLSAAEFAKLQSAKVDASEVLRIDTNKDGQVSLVEHRTAALASFTRFDVDKNGILSDAEMKASSER